MHAKADASVIIVAYNSSPVLTALLTSLADAARTSSLDVLVVDNDSADTSASRTVAERFGAEFLSLGGNLGYGGGANAGFDALESPGRYVLVCNADLEFEPGSIDELIARADDTDGIGAAGPAILNQDGSTYPSARRAPSLREGIGHAVLGKVAPGNPWSSRYRGETEFGDQPRTTDWLSGACLLIPARVFAELGGFDTGYFMYFEDVDLGDRIRSNGLQNLYVPAARVSHIGGDSTRQASSRMLRIHHESAYRYLARRYSGPLNAPLRAALRCGLAIRLRWIDRYPARLR